MSSIYDIKATFSEIQMFYCCAAEGGVFHKNYAHTFVLLVNT